MTPITIISLIPAVAFVALCLFTWEREKSWREAAEALEQDRALGWQTLFALRDRCFITNEKGHRVRYVNATPAARAAAEKL